MTNEDMTKQLTKVFTAIKAKEAEHISDIVKIKEEPIDFVENDILYGGTYRRSRPDRGCGLPVRLLTYSPETTLSTLFGQLISIQQAMTITTFQLQKPVPQSAPSSWYLALLPLLP